MRNMPTASQKHLLGSLLSKRKKVHGARVTSTLQKLSCDCKKRPRYGPCLQSWTLQHTNKYPPPQRLSAPSTNYYKSSESWRYWMHQASLTALEHQAFSSRWVLKHSIAPPHLTLQAHFISINQHKCMCTRPPYSISQAPLQSSMQMLIRN